MNQPTIVLKRHFAIDLSRVLRLFRSLHFSLDKEDHDASVARSFHFHFFSNRTIQNERLLC